MKKNNDKQAFYLIDHLIKTIDLPELIESESNIQLKWYYATEGTTWTNNTEVTFGMSIIGHLKDVNGITANNIDNIFYKDSSFPYIIFSNIFFSNLELNGSIGWIHIPNLLNDDYLGFTIDL